MDTRAPIVCLGQMRSGTTWLWEAFKTSPQSWVPPLKELRLLSSIDELGNTTCRERFAAPTESKKDLDWYITTWRHYLGAMRSQIDQWEKLFWDAPFTEESAQELEFWGNYIAGTYSLDLYGKLIDSVSPRRMVDVSPDYFWCSAKTLSSFYSCFPNASFIVLLRNPFERLISTIKWGYFNEPIIRSADIAEINDWIFSGPIFDDMLRHLNTAPKLEMFSQVFDPKKIFVGFFDDIVNSPDAFLTRLGEFLGVEFHGMPTAKINETEERDLSNEFKSALKGLALVEVEQLRKYIGGPTDLWLHMTKFNSAPGKGHIFQSGPLSELTVR